MKVLYTPFHVLVSIFGYCPINRLTIFLNLLNIVIHCAMLYPVLFNSDEEEKASPDGEVKMWQYFLPAMVLSCTLGNILMVTECFLKREKFIKIRKILLKWMNAEDMKELMQKNSRKYLVAGFLSIPCECFYLTLYKSKTNDVLFIDIYIFFMWLARFLLFGIVVDVLKSKLSVLLDTFDSCVYSRDVLIELQENFIEIQETAKMINQTSKLGIFVSFGEIILVSLDILYWAMIGVLNVGDEWGRLSKILVV